MPNRLHRARLLLMEDSSRRDAHNTDDLRERGFLHSDGIGVEGKERRKLTLPILRDDHPVTDLMVQGEGVSFNSLKDAQYWKKRLVERVRVINIWLDNLYYYLEKAHINEEAENQFVALIQQRIHQREQVLLFIPYVKNCVAEFSEAERRRFEQQRIKREPASRKRQ